MQASTTEASLGSALSLSNSLPTTLPAMESVSLGGRGLAATVAAAKAKAGGVPCGEDFMCYAPSPCTLQVGCQVEAREKFSWLSIVGNIYPAKSQMLC